MAVWWPIWVGAHIRKVTIVIGINWHFCWQRQPRGWRWNGLERVNYPLILRRGAPRAEMKHRCRALWESCCGPAPRALQTDGIRAQGSLFGTLLDEHRSYLKFSCAKMNNGPPKSKGAQVWDNEGYLWATILPWFVSCESSWSESWAASDVICSHDWL